MPKDISQARYTEAEVEQIKALFPDLASLKLYRKYLLNLPLTHEEIDRIQSTWASVGNRAIMFKTTLPIADGTEVIGVGYDVLNNISLSEPNFEYTTRRAAMFVNTVKYLSERLDGLDNLPESATGKAKWLTASILNGDWKNDKGGVYEEEDNTIAILNQLCIKQNVEGILVGLNAIISMKTETPEEKAAREAADSTA